MRLGWRLAGKVYPTSVRRAAEFIELHPNGDARLIRGREVHVSVQTRKDSFISTYLIVDLWLQATSLELSVAEEILKVAESEIASEFDVLEYSRLDVKQEFVDLRLPPFLRGVLSASRATNLINARLKSRNSNVETVRVSNNRIMIGPEQPGAAGALQQYLAEETTARVKNQVLASATYLRWSAILMIVAVLSSWALPLRPWSIALEGVITTVLLAVALTPARKVGMKSMLLRAETVTAIGFYGVVIFGLIYAVFAIRNKESLGEVTSLGYPLLVSTSLGIAGGLIGEARGSVRIIIHIQLILFLTGLIAIVLTLLRLNRDGRSRG